MIHSSSIRRPSLLRPAFTLAEVMFAVMILGIGFIMVAAIFPVALQQAKDSRDTCQASLVAQRAFQIIKMRATAPSNSAAMPSNYNFNPGTGTWTNNAQDWLGTPDMSGRSPYWEMIKGDTIDSQNPGYAWTSIYRRTTTPTGAPNDFALVYVFVCSPQVKQAFEITGSNSDITTSSSSTLPNLAPRLVRFRVLPETILSGGGVEFDNNPAVGQVLANHKYDYQAAAPGAFLVVADAGGSAAPDTTVPAGRVYRLNALAPASGSYTTHTWTLQLGNNDVSNVSPTGTWCRGWLVGNSLVSNPSGLANGNFRGLDPDVPTANAYDGSAQDIALYLSYIRVR